MALRIPYAGVCVPFFSFPVDACFECGCRKMRKEVGVCDAMTKIGMNIARYYYIESEEDAA